MNKTIFLIGINLFISFLLLGQDYSIDKSLEFGITTMYTSKMYIDRDYSKNLKNDITSSYSLGISSHFKFIKKKNEKISWVVGGGFGSYSFNIDFYISDEFNSLGWGGYSDYYTEYKINYIDLLGGLRYILYDNSQNQFFVELNGSVNYHLRSHGTLNTTAILDSGQQKPLFRSTFTNNDNNIIIISPQLGFYYRRIFKDKNRGIILGFNLLYSGREPFIGEYQIIGDNEILRGDLSKSYNYIGLNVSYFTYIKK